MSNTIFSVGTVVRGEDVGIVDFDTVSMVREPSEATLTIERFSAKIGETGAQIASFRKSLNDKYTADMFVKDIAAATNKRLVERIDAVARSSRTFSDKPKKGEVFHVGNQTFAPLLNIWSMRIDSPYKKVMAGYMSAGFQKYPSLQPHLWRALDFVMTSGPRQGFLHRFLQGINRPRTFELKEQDLDILKMNLVLKDSILKDTRLRETTAQLVVKNVMVQIEAEAGLPYDVKRNTPIQIVVNGKSKSIDCLQLVLGDAIKYFDAAAGSSNSDLNDWYAADPGRNLVKLKNKYERVEISKVLTKIRPYYVMPGAQAIVWMYLWQVLSDHFAKFTDVDGNGHYVNTVNAIGFSWASGGTDQLMKWVFSPASSAGTPCLRAFHYADDGVWVATFGTRTFVACVDIEQEDSSLSLGYVRLAGDFILKQWGDVSRVWANILKDNLRAATKMDILAFKQIVLRIMGMLRSGVPGTSFIDLVAAAHNFTLYQGHFDSHADELANSSDLCAGLTAWLLRAHEEIFLATGLRLKAETMVFHEITPGMAEYPVEFLGMQIISREAPDGEQHYFPLFPPWKIAADLWAPKLLDPPANVKDVDMFHKRVQAERIVAMTILGGWQDPKMYSWLRDMHKDLMDQYRVLPVEGFFDSDEDYKLLPQLQLYMKELRNGSYVSFPTVEWCQCIFTGADRAPYKAPTVRAEKGSWAEVAELEDTKNMLMPGGVIALPPQVRNKTTSKIQVPKGPEDPLVVVGSKVDLSAAQGAKQIVRDKVKKKGPVRVTPTPPATPQKGKGPALSVESQSEETPSLPAGKAIIDLEF